MASFADIGLVTPDTVYLVARGLTTVALLGRCASTEEVLEQHLIQPFIDGFRVHGAEYKGTDDHLAVRARFANAWVEARMGSAPAAAAAGPGPAASSQTQAPSGSRTASPHASEAASRLTQRSPPRPSARKRSRSPPPRGRRRSRSPPRGGSGKKQTTVGTTAKAAAAPPPAPEGATRRPKKDQIVLDKEKSPGRSTLCHNFQVAACGRRCDFREDPRKGCRYSHKCARCNDKNHGQVDCPRPAPRR